jgi:hypothetical protein
MGADKGHVEAVFAAVMDGDFMGGGLRERTNGRRLLMCVHDQGRKPLIGCLPKIKVDQAGPKARDDIDDVLPFQGFDEIIETPDLFMNLQVDDVPKENPDPVFAVVR